MKHLKEVGDDSILVIMFVLKWAGYWILMFFGENICYDLIMDDGC